MHKSIRFRNIRQDLFFNLSCLLILCISVFSANSVKAQQVLNFATEPISPTFEIKGDSEKLDDFVIELVKAIGKAAHFQVKFMIYFGLPALLQGIGIDFSFNRFQDTSLYKR